MTDVEPRHRRSRLGWALRTEPTTTPAGTHDHGQRNGPLFLAFFCIVLLFFVNVGLVWFILARGQARDASEQQMRQEIADSWCEALDGFPRDNFFLDQLRDKYDCGPGRPVEELPEDVQRDLNGQATPAPPATPEGVETLPDDFALPGGAVQQEPRQPYYPTPGMAEPEPTIPPPPGFPPPDPVQPTGTPAPLIDLEPITDSVCDALRICL